MTEPVHFVFLDGSHAILALKYLDSLRQSFWRRVPAADVVFRVNSIRLDMPVE